MSHNAAIALRAVCEKPIIAKTKMPATQRSRILAMLFKKGRDLTIKYKEKKPISMGPQLNFMVKMLRPAKISKMPRSMTIIDLLKKRLFINFLCLDKRQVCAQDL